MRKVSAILIPVLALLLFVSCGQYFKSEKKLIPPHEPLPEKPINPYQSSTSYFLKVHLKNGNMYLFSDWHPEPLEGSGSLFNASREKIASGTFRVNTDSVVLYETNKLQQSGVTGAITLMTGVHGAVTAMCLVNPKACFGSCPTFYMSHDDSLQLVAEGFSSSISPSLEALDIDALPPQSGSEEHFTLEMRNEALETHVIRHADLLAVRRPPGEHIFASADGQFFSAGELIAPVAASGPEGDCLNLLQQRDGNERFSLADSVNLAEKESIILAFDHLPDQNPALVLSCRQTLLSTFLLYQSMAYMGSQTGFWLAQVERSSFKFGANSILDLMGGITVQAAGENDEWRTFAVINEHGPLAVDTHVVPLHDLPPESKRIRLLMSKGNWRIDYTAVCPAKPVAEVIRILPSSVTSGEDARPDVLATLHDRDRQLTTMPGDIYQINYRLPGPANQYELFLESRGYYLEWIREQWIAEENPVLFAQIVLQPRQALRRLAPEFKKLEPEMESYFWSSRYARP
jgi:hypothetical protein